MRRLPPTWQPGFYSPEHRQAFIQAARPHRAVSGSLARVCGARTRSGKPCPQAPLAGEKRCHRHGGPDQARRHRERQLQDLAAGRLSPAEWAAAERRRARNRLTVAWRRDPWTPGRTIDLGDAEADLRADLATRVPQIDLDGLAPRVADWLRWRWQRGRIDRQDMAGWIKALGTDLPQRVAAAGPRPAGGESVGNASLALAYSPVWNSNAPQGGGPSRRGRPDRPKAPPLERGLDRISAARTRTPDADEGEELAAVWHAHRAILGPLLGTCADEGQRLHVLRALRDFLANPQDRAAVALWRDVVMRFRPH